MWGDRYTALTLIPSQARRYRARASFAFFRRVALRAPGPLTADFRVAAFFAGAFGVAPGRFDFGSVATTSS